MDFFKRGFLIFLFAFLMISCRRKTSDLLEASENFKHSYMDMVLYLFENVSERDMLPYLHYMEGEKEISLVSVLCRNNFIMTFEYRKNEQTDTEELFKYSLSKSAEIKNEDIGLTFQQFYDKYGAAAYSYIEDGTRHYVYMTNAVNFGFFPPYFDTMLSRTLTKVLVKDEIVVNIKEVYISYP